MKIYVLIILVGLLLIFGGTTIETMTERGRLNFTEIGLGLLCVLLIGVAIVFQIMSI